jgi:acetylornithine deacetylase
MVTGGRELSSYPDRCRLQMERRTIGGESGEAALREVTAILDDLTREDGEFEASATLAFARPPYELAPDHPLPCLLVEAVESLGTPTSKAGMSFWTDAAVLGAAGIPSVLFGPGGAGLHSLEEYVTTRDVVTCRDALSRLIDDWC